MKATGFIRPVDELGRVVLPKKLRQERGILPGELIETWLDGESVLMERYTGHCVFCGTTDSIFTFKDKTLCITCVSELKKTQRN